MEKMRNRIKELVNKLNEASEAYYNDKDEIMSNYEWDRLYDELVELEKNANYVLPESPTQKTGTVENITNGRREQHEFPALSLAKTKQIEELQKWAEDKEVWVTGKYDGATLVLSYTDGILESILTRGNGYEGTNITFMAEGIKGIPRKIKEKGHMVIRGEATISYSDFEEINNTIDDDDKYANPRNLVAGSLGLDATRIDLLKERKITFNAFTLVYTVKDIKSWGKRMDFLDELGFITVDRELTNANKLPGVIEKWTANVEAGKIDIPLDGLVITYEDTEYASTGSVTGHHATRAGLAYKWEDEVAETILDHIEWSCAVSTISPVAVFDEVQLEGTKVTRASLCNISELKRLGIGADRKTKLKIIKANKIIPKCIEADSNGTMFTIPVQCPVCGADTKIHISTTSQTETLHCVNPSCTAKHIKKFERFVSKSGMDIDGLSRETIVKFINKGFIHDFSDIFHLYKFKNEIVRLDGFGEKSYNNLINAIEKARNTTLSRFITSLGIPMIGVDAAKKIFATMGIDEFVERLEMEKSFEDIDGIGYEKSKSILNWYQNEKNRDVLEKLLQEISIEKIQPLLSKDGALNNIVFVITGDVHHFKNREEFKEYVESHGGKVTGSVSGKTNYLVNNDVSSTSGKNKKAKELNIPIISEDEFMRLFVN
ncbi:NAD-dependent DNA ligase LigA [Cellulosilyticum sp. ST5]|uniref:NAD-dependent DNA ligase LigA n=1 Tax=Cellulosilyticum sp. ST5 TaxID=3055805 RepID=UPI0039775DB5